MAVIIAGREVKIGDTLYHVAFQAWGTVQRFDTNSAVLRLTLGNEVFVASGGVTNGKRQVYWHQPLVLDLPVSNVSKYQEVLDYLLTKGL